MNTTDRFRFMNADEYEKTRYDKKKSQKQMCLEYLETFGSITPLEALSAFHCYRLSAVIFELREAGYAIDTDINDGETRYAIYTLQKEEVEENG